MGKRSSRVAVLMLLVIVAAATSIFVFRVERRIADLSASERTLSEHLDRIRTTAVEIGQAQQSYVAPGQLDQRWVERTSALFEQLRDDVAALPSLLESAGDEARQQLIALLDTFVEADTRARQNLEIGEELMAADVIYSDGRNVLDAFIAQVDRTRLAERSSHAAASGALVSQRWASIGLAGFLWLCGLAALTFSAPARPARATGTAPLASPAALAATTDLPIAPDVTPMPPLRTEPGVDLHGAAALCQDLSRVADARGLGELLGRAAALIDASGVVLWAGDGEHLLASVSHGYTAEQVGRFGPIARAADNGVAQAWRSAEVVAISADRDGPGALVVPIMGGSGCVGALAFETHLGAEHKPDVQALARIVAAQVAAVALTWPATEVMAPPASARSA